MKMDDKITINTIENHDILNIMQPNHYVRKATMFYSILAMKVMFKKVPKYELRILMKYSKQISLKTNLKIFYGTLKRIIKGKIN